MATVHTASGITGLVFGLTANETAELATSKVSISKKIKKKDLRSFQGGYKAVVSFGPTYDATIEGALLSADGGFTLGGTHTLINDPFSLASTMFVESITINEKNDDFKRISVKLVGSDAF